MPQIIDLKEGLLRKAAKRGFRNWVSRFKEEFGPGTRLSQISMKTLSYLAQGKEKGTFYLYDLIMNLNGLGSGFEFNELSPKKRIIVIDRHLFLLDQIRFECMKRLGWLDSYPGEGFSLVKLITEFDKLGPGLHAKIPVLNKDHPAYNEYTKINTFERESLVRALMPEALEKIEEYSITT